MILKRLEKDGKVKAMFKSATVAASTYNTATGDLTVIFNNGGTYSYPAVAKTDYMRFELAESTGSEFNTHIKKKYTNFTKLESMPSNKLTLLLSEIKELSDNEVKIDDKTIVEDMLKIVSAYVKDGTINKTTLGSFIEVAGKYI